MTNKPEFDPRQQFVPNLLPWVVAAGALAVYLLTLNPWVSLTSLGSVARVSGWTWAPEINQPLHWLVTLPFQLLPDRLVPLGLNLLSALLACLSLALLARSVALLPHDRTINQRIREHGPYSLLSLRLAWLPPVLAALVCGLQLTFWEHATVSSAEMLDLLLFAYVVRCLLEYRINERDAWLYRSALVYGLGMTNNWAMVAFLPLFFGALVWTKGVGFFDGRFLGRMALLGLAGLTLYLLLPLVYALTTGEAIGFWQALKHELASQKQILLSLPFNKSLLLRGLDGSHPLWVLGLPTLLPVVLMAIRWPSHFGDPSKLGIALSTAMFHVVHGLLLVVCLWVTLDPENFGPRQLLPDIPMLTLYYLGALSVGYLSGYFLLVFGVTPTGRPRFVEAYPPLLNKVVCGVVLVLAGLTPCLLVWRNLPQIRLTNGPMLRHLAGSMASMLPPRNSVVLSDDLSRLLLVQSDLTQKGRTGDYLLLSSEWLKRPEYLRFLKQQNPAKWQFTPPQSLATIPDLDLLRILYRLSETNQIYYLQPSFGYFFELFYSEPRGVVYHLKEYPPDTALVPPLNGKVIEENEKFWLEASGGVLRTILAAVTPPAARRDPGVVAQLMAKAQLGWEVNREAAAVAACYSQALNYWAVQLQRNGRLKEAADQFELALRLNPENVSARVNLECNASLQAGGKTSVQLSKSVEDLFGKYRNWNQLLRQNGPFDEPTFSFEQARVFARGGNYRQAAQEFDRVKALAPENLASRLFLAKLYVLNRLPDQSLREVQEIRSQASLLGISRTNETELLSAEISAHLARKDPDKADGCLEAALKRYPRDGELLGAASAAYLEFGYFTNALWAINQHLALQPDNPLALINKGYAAMQTGAFAEAVPPLTRVLALETNTLSELHMKALFNRAISYLRSDKLNEAQQDYECLQKAVPSGYPFYYGLGEIAYRKKDTNAAVRNYQLYLANAPTNTTEARGVNDRLKELGAGRL